MNDMYIEVIEVQQPIGTFYISKIDGKKLYNMAKADIREIKNGNDYLGIQRNLDRQRVRSINDYINTVRSAFPNSIILNLNKDHFISIEENRLHMNINPETFSIIDGQHRLAGFDEEQKLKGKFELVVAIFIDLDIEDQAILFSTINSEQKRVDPSFKYDLESYISVKTPRKVVRDIALAFNRDQDSPWNGKIKMIGKKDELTEEPIITLKAFAEPIIDLIYNDKEDMYRLRDELYEYKDKNKLKDNYLIKETINFERYKYASERYIFWKFYNTDREDVIYRILINYFNVLKELLCKDWCNNESILNKTTGYNAIMKIFSYIYKDAYINKDFSVDFFRKRLYRLNILDGQITSDKFGGSGQISTIKLYKEMKEIIDNPYGELANSYINQKEKDIKQGEQQYFLEI